MAGDWIKMRSNLWDDPRISRLVDETNSCETMIVGALYWLWATADQHSADGAMPGMTLRTINRKTGVEGLGEALVAIGWLKEYDAGVCLVRFDEHNGESAKRRCVDAKRKANVRNLSDKTRTHDGQDAEVLRRISELEKEKRREELTPTTPDGVVVASRAGDQPPANDDDGAFKLTGTPASGPARKECPHEKIIELYHEILPQCPPVRTWTTTRRTNLRARWNEDPQRQDLAYWRRLFEYVGTCDFLVGRAAVHAGRSPFIADLEWITRLSNFTKIREARYENRA